MAQKINFKAFGTVAALFLLLSTNAYAHEENTTIADKEVGNYTVEFEYQQEGPVVAGAPYDYNFFLLNKDTKAIIPTDSMFVRFEDSASNILMGASLASSASFNGRVTGVMPAEGTYNITVQFFKGGAKLAEATAPLAVVDSNASVAPAQDTMPIPSTDTQWYWWVGIFAIGVVAGFVLKNSFSKAS